MTAIVWFRNDLRVHSNPALHAAMQDNSSILPLYIVDTTPSNWPVGSAARWWLHYSLKALSKQLADKGLELKFYRGQALNIVLSLVEKHNATSVYWNRRYEPDSIQQDHDLKSHLNELGVKAHSYHGSLLYEPWQVLKQDGTPYKVFTPFWRAAMAKGVPQADATPRKSGKHKTPATDSLSLKELQLLPTKTWADDFRQYWTPGENQALKNLRAFIDNEISDYSKTRDLPACSGTSQLSAHLHFGELSARQIASAITQTHKPHSEAYLRQLVWRDFAHSLLYHFPNTDLQPLDTRFKKFCWRKSYATHLRAWQRGRTGIPLVDAGMRELWSSGWMHNRVRMVVASFLTKNLLIPWQEGARWFWDTLLDADLANNSMGWQWVAGSGADAAPYFRIFNPVLQSKKFDPRGDYIRTWLPELRHLPEKYIHSPWEAPGRILKDAQLILGKDYPQPIVDLQRTRERALEKYKRMRA